MKNDIYTIWNDVPLADSDDENSEICEYVENKEKHLAKLIRWKLNIEKFLEEASY